MLFSLSILFGSFVGFALGLIGGGGSLLAVPLLVYGLAIAPREAFGLSLAVVGLTALIGVVPRIRTGQVEVGTGVLFSVAGMLGAPLGTWASGMIPETVLLTLFSVLMLIVAWRMWTKSKAQNLETARKTCGADARGLTCQRMPDGKLRLTSRCAMLLAVVGLSTEILVRHVRRRWRICDCTGIGVVYRNADQEGRGNFVACDCASECFWCGVALCRWPRNIAGSHRPVCLGWCHWNVTRWAGQQTAVGPNSAKSVRDRHCSCRDFHRQ